MIFRIISTAILLAFYGCYFGKMILQRRKGIKTDHMGKGKIGFVKFIEVMLKIVTFIVPVVEAISIFVLPTLSPVWLQWIGAVVSVLGVAVFICSVVTMKDSWRAGVSKDKTELITSGIYQISRNPAFLGFDLVYIGILLMFFNLWLLAASVFAIMMLHLQIVNVEEDFLLATFGEEYLNYRKKVCRYIGRKR